MFNSLWQICLLLLIWYGINTLIRRIFPPSPAKQPFLSQYQNSEDARIATKQMRKTAFARAALWFIACFLLSYILPGRTAPPQRVHSKSSTTELIETLQDTNNDDQQRLAAAGILRNRGQEAIPAMTQALSDPNREVRNTAVVSLAQSDVSLTEAEAKAVLPTFIGALQDGDSRVTIAACQLLEKIEPKPTQMVLALIDACNHKDRRVRAAAMTVFQNMNAAAIPALIEGLQSGDTEICLAATRLLGSQGTKAKAAAADLQVTLTDQNVEVRMASMRSLRQIIGSDAIPALTECLSDPNSMARAEAIQVLSAFGPEAGTVLSAAMKNNYWDVRQGAAVALGRMQVSNSIAISALTEAVRDENADVQVAAIGAISNQELSTTTIVSTLNPAFNDENKEVRAAAIQCLGNINADATFVLPKLTAALDDVTLEVREEAIHSLAKMGTEAASTLPTLAEMLEDEEADIRVAVIDALSSLMGPAAVPLLVKALQDEEFVVREAVVMNFTRMGPKAKAAVPALTESLNENDLILNGMIKRAIRHIESPAPSSRLP